MKQQTDEDLVIGVNDDVDDEEGDGIGDHLEVNRNNDGDNVDTVDVNIETEWAETLHVKFDVKKRMN